MCHLLDKCSVVFTDFLQFLLQFVRDVSLGLHVAFALNFLCLYFFDALVQLFDLLFVEISGLLERLYLVRQLLLILLKNGDQFFLTLKLVV